MSQASQASVALPRRRVRGGAGERASTALSLGFVTTYLSIFVALPIAALVWESTKTGDQGFWEAISDPQAVAALKLTLGVSIAAALINAVMGTITAWVLVRDDFRGKVLVNAIIDLPFALPTIVAGLTLLALYGPQSPIGVNVAFTRTAIVLALLFVTLPLVVRTVQPVLLEIDEAEEEAARVLGATRWYTFRRVVLPKLRSGIAAGGLLAFARAIGEFGAVVIVSGNIIGKTLTAPVLIFQLASQFQPNQAAAVATLLFAISFVLVLVTERLVGARNKDAV